MNKKLVPRLRFKQFNDEWKHTKINNIAKVVGGGTPSTKNLKYWNGNINWYSPDEISNNNKAYTYESKNKITQEGLKNSSAKLHPANSTILFTSRANIGSMSILKYKATTNQGFQSLELNNDIYPYFIYSDKGILKYKAFKVAHGSTFLEISNKELKNIKLNIPTLSEQQHIGAFFAKLDHMIALQSKKITHLKQLKKGYLQKMFPQQGKNVPRLRFNGFHDEWHKKKLKDICHSKSSKHSLKQSKNLQMGKYPIYDVNNIIGYINDFDQNIAYISIIKDGSGVGKTRIHSANSSIISTMNYILPNANINIYYLNLLLNTLNLLKYKIGTGIPHIYFNDYSNINILIPNLQEQNKIGRFFKHYDKSITQQENKLTQLKQFKKAYLQKMFC